MNAEGARRWFEFVRDLDRREPKTPPVERNPSLNMSGAIIKREPLVTCRWCGKPFSPPYRPICSQMHKSLCTGIDEKLP